MKVIFLCNEWNKDYYLLRNDDDSSSILVSFDGRLLQAGLCICYGISCSTPVEVQFHLRVKFGKNWQRDLPLYSDWDVTGEVAELIKKFKEAYTPVGEFEMKKGEVDQAADLVRSVTNEIETAKWRIEREIERAKEDIAKKEKRLEELSRVLADKKSTLGEEPPAPAYPDLAAMAAETKE